MTTTRRLDPLHRRAEGLSYGRQSIPTFVPGHRLNFGPFAAMGVGLPFAVGAKAARPARAECDGTRHSGAAQTAATLRDQPRRRTADPERNKPGRDLGYTRYEKMAEALGCSTNMSKIRAALQRAWAKVEEGMVGFVNGNTDYRTPATKMRFPTRKT